MKTIITPFDITSKESGPLLYAETIPEFFKVYEIPGATHVVAFGSFGHMSIQQYAPPESPWRILYINAILTKEETFFLTQHEDILTLDFALNNNRIYSNGNNATELIEGYFNIFFTPQSTVELKMGANRLYSFFSIQLLDDYLSEWYGCYPMLKYFMSEIDNGNPPPLCDINQLVNPQMNEIIRQIIQNKYTGFAKSLYVDIKIKEIFMLAMDKISSCTSVNTLEFSQSEIERFYEAKEVLVSNIQNPMSLKQMARKFGINTKKIKTGFKQLYEMTPFNLILSTRMEKAKKMLTSSEMDITSIADEIGYNNKHSFSKAFKKYFGYSPGRYRKSKQQNSSDYSTI